MNEKPKVPHINARTETVHELPLFREAFAKRRALIPAAGFFEWQARNADGKQPYHFVREDMEPFPLPAYGSAPPFEGEEILSATIIVGKPNSLVAGVHDRMPVMLMALGTTTCWLDPAMSIDELQRYSSRTIPT